MTSAELPEPATTQQGVDPTWGFVAHLRRLMQAYAASWAAQVSPTLTSVQFGVLAQLRREPGLDQKTLAGLLSMDKATAGGVVKRLTGRGLIQVLRDPADSRRNVLVLTTAGRTRLEQTAPLVDALRHQAFASLSDDDRDTFIRSIEAVIAQLDATRQAAQ